MAGDWLKMRVDLLTSPKVVRISSGLKQDRLTTIGGLFAVWSIFDAHSEDGNLEGYTREILDDMVGLPGISSQMVLVQWLEDRGTSLYMPRFTSHNGKSAKNRATDSERKRLSRIGQKSGSEPDKITTREEKRREENTLSLITIYPETIIPPVILEQASASAMVSEKFALDASVGFIGHFLGRSFTEDQLLGELTKWIAREYGYRRK